MKRVEMTVVFSVLVPDEADVEDLTLNIDTNRISVGTVFIEKVTHAEVTGYETTACDMVGRV